MPSLKAGRLRHRVALQRKVPAQDPVSGEQTYAWAVVPGMESVPAAIDPLSARDFMSAQAVQSQIVARITMRYRSGLDASMRIVHKSTIYNIAGLLPDNDSGLEYFTVPVSAGVNDG